MNTWKDRHTDVLIHMYHQTLSAGIQFTYKEEFIEIKR